MAYLSFTNEELTQYKVLLHKITKNAIEGTSGCSLNEATRQLNELSILQNHVESHETNSLSIADRISTLVDECKNYGTLPFAIIARHAFIAEGLLRSAVNKKVISAERIQEFKLSFKTISGEMSNDFQSVLCGRLDKESYLLKYGHLRPGSYDILSLTYNDRKDLFDGVSRTHISKNKEFNLTSSERRSINKLLGEHGFDNVTADKIFNYAKTSIIGREYAKFIFTKHLSEILEQIVKWGEIEGFSREDLSMLSINDVLSVLFAPLNDESKAFYEKKIKKSAIDFSVASSFKLNYLIRSVRDIHIVPMQRSAANFIGDKRVEGETVELNPYLTHIPLLENKIVCIEGADPGYDWIFTRNIAGLITKYGGANSHMAIRCAEYNLHAAIGCGEQPFNRVVASKRCILDCQRKNLDPIEI
jgi:hypothetical protein